MEEVKLSPERTVIDPVLSYEIIENESALRSSKPCSTSIETILSWNFSSSASCPFSIARRISQNRATRAMSSRSGLLAACLRRAVPSAAARCFQCHNPPDRFLALSWSGDRRRGASLFWLNRINRVLNQKSRGWNQISAICFELWALYPVRIKLPEPDAVAESIC